MVLSLEIENAIEQEIQKRLHEKLEGVLKMISKTYKISFDGLLKDVASMKTETPLCISNICCGVLKTGGKCKSKTKPGENYCKRHETQKPKHISKNVVVQSESSSSFLEGLKNSKLKKKEQNVQAGDSSQVD